MLNLCLFVGCLLETAFVFSHFAISLFPPYCAFIPFDFVCECRADRQLFVVVNRTGQVLHSSSTRKFECARDNDFPTGFAALVREQQGFTMQESGMLRLLHVAFLVRCAKYLLSDGEGGISQVGKVGVPVYPWVWFV